HRVAPRRGGKQLEANGQAVGIEPDSAGCSGEPPRGLGEAWLCKEPTGRTGGIRHVTSGLHNVVGDCMSRRPTRWTGEACRVVEARQESEPAEYRSGDEPRKGRKAKPH